MWLFKYSRLKKKGNIFNILCFMIPRELKMQRNAKKKNMYLQGMEKVLWLDEYVKSGLWSFVLEISHWTMLHGQGRSVEANSNQIKTLIENNQCYTMRDSRCTRNIQISVENQLHQLGYVDHFDVWVPHSSQLLNRVQLFGTPQTVSCQAPLAVEFSRQEYWSG